LASACAIQLRRHDSEIGSSLARKLHSVGRRRRLRYIVNPPGLHGAGSPTPGHRPGRGRPDVFFRTLAEVNFDGIATVCVFAWRNAPRTARASTRPSQRVRPEVRRQPAMKRLAATRLNAATPANWDDIRRMTLVPSGGGDLRGHRRDARASVVAIRSLARIGGCGSAGYSCVGATLDGRLIRSMIPTWTGEAGLHLHAVS
jgi:hypothetical protein